MDLKKKYFGILGITGFILGTFYLLKINLNNSIIINNSISNINHIEDINNINSRNNIEDINNDYSLNENIFNLDQYENKNIITYDFKNFLHNRIKEKTVLIFEYNNYHHECIPGFAKYFLDLGYHVDILIIDKNENTFSFFPLNDKIKIFLFKDYDQIIQRAQFVKEAFDKYDYILINSTNFNKNKFFELLGVFYSKKAIFVTHGINWVESMNASILFEENRAIILALLDKGSRVNPHYFGEFPLKNKDGKTRFFMTSTVYRDYHHLVNASELLKNEGLDFEITVVGRSKTFNEKSIPQDLKNYYNFEFRVTYSKMYEKIINSDYIIITLDPDNDDAQVFKHYRATGSAQLSYGFLKPSLIHQEYAPIYNMTDKDSFLFDKYNFVDIMRKAIKMTNKEYKEKQINLKHLSDNIYKESLENLKAMMKI